MQFVEVVEAHLYPVSSSAMLLQRLRLHRYTEPDHKVTARGTASSRTNHRTNVKRSSVRAPPNSDELRAMSGNYRDTCA